ncbi:MAG: hypothetical protein HN952_07220 [Candidatus Cloacimonetes bacterium]|jgi:hypothetical protein|nr:hypothetical protein [Candidatus Cloacimonadota bacterium]MBT6994725.1 hypothetical protein [Candidatus Cloacimonadota bacterium]MBT7469185.1 hypothetical protein [Candidatus Cloacimonadota bacterium]
MRKFWKIFAVTLSFLLLAAHFGRANLFVLQYLSLALPFLLFWKSEVSNTILHIALILGGLEWIRTIIYYTKIRIVNGDDWIRLVIILGLVTCFTLCSAVGLKQKK